eukprot:g4544.t1
MNWNGGAAARTFTKKKGFVKLRKGRKRDAARLKRQYSFFEEKRHASNSAKMYSRRPRGSRASARNTVSRDLLLLQGEHVPVVERRKILHKRKISLKDSTPDRDDAKLLASDESFIDDGLELQYTESPPPMVQEVFEPSLYESAKESQSTSSSNAKTGRGFQSGVKFFNNGVQVDEIGIPFRSSSSSTGTHVPGTLKKEPENQDEDHVPADEARTKEVSMDGNAWLVSIRKACELARHSPELGYSEIRKILPMIHRVPGKKLYLLDSVQQEISWLYQSKSASALSACREFESIKMRIRTVEKVSDTP